MANRKQYSAEFKAKVTLSAIRGAGTLEELASRYKIHPNMITKWKRKAREGMNDRFVRGGKTTRSGRQAGLAKLRAKIGELVVKRDFFATRLSRQPVPGLFPRERNHGQARIWRIFLSLP